MKRYGQWTGNPKGYPEDETRCTERVFGSSYVNHQCTRKRGYGPDKKYCKQHGKQRDFL